MHLRDKKLVVSEEGKGWIDSNPTDGLDVSNKRMCQSERELVGIGPRGQARGSPEKLV